MTDPDTPETPDAVTHGIQPALVDHAEPIGAVRPYPGNARQHDLDRLAASLTTNGQFRCIIANRRTGHIIKGNGTYAAASKRLGWTHIAVAWVDVDADTERRMVLVDNRSSELGWFNDAALVATLTSLGSLEGTGYHDDELAKLEASLEGALDLLPPSPKEPGGEIVDAKRKYDLAEMRQLVLVTDSRGYDQLMSDLDALRDVHANETFPEVVLRVVRAAAA